MSTENCDVIDDGRITFGMSLNIVEIERCAFRVDSVRSSPRRVNDVFLYAAGQNAVSDLRFKLSIVRPMYDASVASRSIVRFCSWVKNVLVSIRSSKNSDSVMS